MVDIRIVKKSLTATAPAYTFELGAPDARGVLTAGGRKALEMALAPQVNSEGLPGFAVAEITGSGDAAEVRFTHQAGSGKISLKFYDGGVVYRYSLSAPAAVTRIGPGPARGEFFQVHNFDPDLEKLDIPHRITSPIQFNSRLTLSQEFLHFDCGNYIIPPYLVALFDKHAYIGFGLLDVPDVDMPINGQATVEQFSHWLDYGPRAQPAPYESPRFGLFISDSKPALLDAYAAAALGEHPRAATQPQPWWCDPIYTTWGDQVYAKHLAEGKFPKEAGSEKYLTAALVDSALARLAEHAIRPGTIILDEGWSRAMGDWRAEDARFGGSLAACIRAKQAAGHHVVLYFNPFLVDAAAPVVTEHPQWLVAKADGAKRTIERSGRTYNLLDWSNPLCRAAARKAVAQIVAPAGLGADGVKLAGVKFLPEPGDVLADPTYGLGERYLQSVLRDIREAAHAAAPRAPIFLACLNPLLGDTFDIIRTGNTSEVNHDEQLKRAGYASRLMSDKPIDTDDWASYAKVLGAVTFSKAAVGIPNLFSAFYRGDARPRYGGAMGGSPMRMDERQYRIIAAAWKAYEFSRTIPRGRLVVDFDRLEFAMAAPAADGAFVRTYNGGNTLAVYDGKNLYLACVQAGPVVLVLPKGFRPTALEQFGQDGHSGEIPFTAVLGDKVMFEAGAAKDGVMYYRLRGA
jgi:hypothetical protein